MIVVDASVVVNFVLDTKDASAAAAAIAGEDLRAPDVIDFEVMATIRRLAVTDTIDPALAREALATHLALSIERAASPMLLMRAFELRSTVSAGDALYVALAELLGCPLVTADRRLARLHGHDAEIIVAG